MKPQKAVGDSEEPVRRGAPRRSVREGFLCRRRDKPQPREGSALETDETRQKATAGVPAKYSS